MDFQFLQTSAAFSADALMPPRGVFAASSDTLRIALIGCGSRGTEAARDSLQSSEGVELVAMADMFRDRLDASLAELKGKFGHRVKVKPDTCFLEFDAGKQIQWDWILNKSPLDLRPAKYELGPPASDAGGHPGSDLAGVTGFTAPAG